MPRGRHRHSPPLHRLLPPAAVAGASLSCAAGAWLLGDPVGLRVLVAAAAAAAVVGAFLMRSWDRAAGKRVAELATARIRDEWRTDERIAELETDVEESRELRSALEARLRAKRGELARLRGEHAELLRRYATAETERASALEGRRLLALEAAAPAKALPATADGLDANGAPTPSTYIKADKALTELIRNRARQQAQRTVQAARRRDLAEREAEQPQGKHKAAAEKGAPSRTVATDDATTGSATGSTAGSASGSAAGTGKRTPPPANEHHSVPIAAAVVPYTPTRRSLSRHEGRFDFFGTQAAGAGGPESSASGPGADDDSPDHSAATDAAVTDAAVTDEDEDLADVVGPEVLAEHEADVTGEVIDLTAHDETEQIDVRELRAHSS
ncbi:hypothetical protein ABZW18_17280 [Streptomyces sp. NPDC004647]|uniref:hypothetical protein n=1 Tax=Streptomyces sp. NPDC004647 TaxID=3154671 RepID=UPI0033BDE7C3